MHDVDATREESQVFECSSSVDGGLRGERHVVVGVSVHATSSHDARVRVDRSKGEMAVDVDGAVFTSSEDALRSAAKGLMEREESTRFAASRMGGARTRRPPRRRPRRASATLGGRERGRDERKRRRGDD